MTFLFLLYIGFTLYLYFTRDPIRMEVNFVVRRWYDQIASGIRRMRKKSTSIRRRRY
ncbi:hypothetical protein [Synechococcus sp. PCC 7336]|uniref:hypothetical protein n=1 Tax=Synechococcus sp. PCC 7336 TaxID=195250 RepID=UPI00034B280F|nr:hypothetical protein [Synechococcus sp. PCC 7336]